MANQMHSLSGQQAPNVLKDGEDTHDQVGTVPAIIREIDPQGNLINQYASLVPVKDTKMIEGSKCAPSTYGYNPNWVDLVNQSTCEPIVRIYKF